MLDMEVDCPLTRGPDWKRDKAITIQYKPLEGPGWRRMPLTVLRSWDYGSESAMFEAFFDATAYWEKKWDFVPVVFNAGMEMPWLWDRGVRLGRIPWGSNPYTNPKPFLDAQQVAYLFNYDRLRQEGERGDMPDCFVGAKLQNYSRKMRSGKVIPELYAMGPRGYNQIIKYVQQESDAFCDLWAALTATMPSVWRDIVRPAIREDPGRTQQRGSSRQGDRGPDPASRDGDKRMPVDFPSGPAGPSTLAPSDNPEAAATPERLGFEPRRVGAAIEKRRGRTT